MAIHIGRRKFLATLGGAAAAWPLAARAQQAPLPVIGFMSSRSPEDSPHMIEAFRRGLKEGGFVEGENVAIEFRWARGDYSRLPANRPGGNVTGVTLLTNMMEPKRLGLLRELAPGVALIGALVNPKFPPGARQAQEIEQAARAVGQRIVIAKASTDDELEAAFAFLMGKRIGALLVTADPYFDTRRQRIVAFAAGQRLPAIYQFREYVVAGGVLSYGVSITEGYRQYGLYTAKILNGTKPPDLPVLQATKYELVINLKTAQALGIAISDNLRSLADEVIE